MYSVSPAERLREGGRRREIGRQDDGLEEENERDEKGGRMESKGKSIRGMRKDGGYGKENKRNEESGRMESKGKMRRDNDGE